jgi:hypothetical protein
MNLKSLTFFSRSSRVSEPSVSANVNLLPRDVFKGDKETLALYDQYMNLRTAIADNDRAAGRAKVQAEEAKTAYARAVREALSNGADPSKVQSDVAQYEATAQAHADLSRQARSGLERISRTFAERIATVAPVVIPRSEERLTNTADTMRHAIAALTEAWRDYSAAWSERRILGDINLNGGALGAYDPAGTFPPAVRAALDTLTNHLNDLDTLKADEQHIREWRQRNAQADDQNRRARPAVDATA